MPASIFHIHKQARCTRSINSYIEMDGVKERPINKPSNQMTGKLVRRRDILQALAYCIDTARRPVDYLTKHNPYSAVVLKREIFCQSRILFVHLDFVSWIIPRENTQPNAVFANSHQSPYLTRQRLFLKAPSQP